MGRTKVRPKLPKSTSISYKRAGATRKNLKGRKIYKHRTEQSCNLYASSNDVVVNNQVIYIQAV